MSAGGAGPLLWLSYQRYGLALVAGPPLVVAAVAASWPAAWWAWGPLAGAAAAALRQGVVVLGRLPDKLRATRIADRRIAAGRFRPDGVRALCGDPCSRVVAHELLRRAGEGRAARRARIARLAGELRGGSDEIVAIDHARGVAVTRDGRVIAGG